VQIFQDLTIKGKSPELESFAREIETSLKDNWSRNRAMEEEVRPLDRSPSWCFAFAGSGEKPAAFLWLAYREPNELYVPNIVPAGTDRLSREQYNSIVQEFYEEFVKDAAHKTGVRAELGREKVELEDLLSKDTAQALRRFSGLANKSTGSSHPRDRTRWEEFLISAHREESTLAPDELERWLIEEQQWPSDKASDLAIEYEEAMSLLKAYDARIQRA
jgi:hypothetical protein